MALARSGTSRSRGRVVALFTIFLIATLALVPSALCRPVPSGWDLSSSTGSSDSTLWRHFTTKTQAVSYHRLLLDLEKSMKAGKKLPTKSDDSEQTEPTESYAEDMFTTMDYANPRSNASGSSDDLSPPIP